MFDKKKKSTAEELVIEYLKKNNDLFVHHPDLLEKLEFPVQLKGSNKIIDLNAYRSKKIKDDYESLKKHMTNMLKTGSSNLMSQKRILKSSIKILKTKTITNLINVIINDLHNLLSCDIIKCFFTSNRIKHNGINKIGNKVVLKYFLNKNKTYLKQDPDGIPLFFSNKSKIVKSYILLKIAYDQENFIIAMGSKNKNKFTKDQEVDLIEYLIQVMQIKLIDLKL